MLIVGRQTATKICSSHKCSLHGPAQLYLVPPQCLSKTVFGAGQRSQLQADLSEARTLLKLMSRQASERLERLAADKEAELTAAQSRLADADRWALVRTPCNLLCVMSVASHL